MTTSVIKQRSPRSREPFDNAKLQRSIAATCRSVRCPDGQAEQIAAQVAQGVEKWLATKPVVTSNDIRRRAAQGLVKLHEEAAYLYQHQPELL